ncbi:MAG: bifunctional metallophosphatase/5'-nucleotidase [Candidatus Dadabacteria bacterium]
MKNKYFVLLLTGILFLQGCTTYKGATSTDDGKIRASFVQINDVYEIAPLSGGKEGGMARVATLKKQYLANNPNTCLVIAGDFLSPSVYNSLQYQGKAIRGKQMVDVMNAAGMDIAMFGNHEFDIRESELQDRINESKFQWISSNSFHKMKDQVAPFVKQNAGSFPQTYIKQIHDADGTTARIGFFAVTLPFNRADYVSYTDPLSTAKEMYNHLRDSVDAVIAITHQAMEDDEKLATELPGLTAIIGGHEHDGRFKKVGKVYITKALANAKTAYVVNVTINKKKHKTSVQPVLEKVDDHISLDPATNEVVQKWSRIAEENYSSLGFDAKKVVINKGEPLEGREVEVRKNPTNLTRLIVKAMAEAAPKADVVLLNGGSIRVDDVLQMPVTEYDILRTLPFGGAIKEADVKGSVLINALNVGNRNVGIGGYLHYNEGVVYNEGTNTWSLNGKPLDPNATYRLAITDFLLTGKEANLDFLNPTNPGVVKVYEGQASPALSDIRMAVVQYLEKHQDQYITGSK